MLSRLIVLFIASAIFSACCTKKDCDADIFPIIVIKYEGFSDSELDEKLIIVIDKESSLPIDSVELTYSTDLVKIDKRLMYDIFGEKFEIKQYNYLLKLKNRKDTIRDIIYERFSENIDCNTCFPVGNGSATVTNYKNLEFMHNNELYLDIDTVIILKTIVNKS